MLQLYCLGTPRIKLPTESAPPKLTAKALALFVYLVVTGGVHSRNTLAGLLWSEMDNQQARNNLRYTLLPLRALLDAYLLITPKTLSFNRQAPAWLDVEVLRTTVTAQPDTIALPRLQAALELYQGDFLLGFTVRNAPLFEEWVTQQRTELHTLVVQGWCTLAERCWQQGAYQEGLAATQRLLQYEPWHEAGQRLYMQLLTATGQRPAAIAQYGVYRQRLADEVGATPEPATTLLYEQLSRGEFPGEKTGTRADAAPITVADLPSPRTPYAGGDFSPPPNLPHSPTPSLPHNLPNSLTPFFGREQELEQLSSLLADAHYRLVTLVGEGGSGKTRLALAVAQTFLPSAPGPGSSPDPQKSKLSQQKFPDGVWFMALGALTTNDNLPDQIAMALAQAVGLPFGGNQPLFTQLLAYLHNKTLLLVFDNVEHLLPAVADVVVQLLQASPSITVLITSRHILSLQAEFVWRVTGLPVPADTNLPPSALLAYSSIALFVERAKRLHRSFQMTTENQTAIVAICRLVGGLPLAIELAAALTQQYTSAALYATLQRDYTILATTFRDLPPQHRSIKAVLDHSWRLLIAQEAQILAACAVFPGSFDLAAVKVIAGADREQIAKLVDQSLVHEVQDADGKRRYVLHPLVHHYADAQLQRQPEVAHRLHMQHCTYYLALLVRQGDALVREPAARETLQMEIDNLRVAWAWAIEQGEFAQLQQCSKPLAQFYEMAGFYREAEAAFRQAADRLGASAAQVDLLSTDQMRLLATLQVEQAYFCIRLAQLDKAETLAQAALQVGLARNDGVLKAQSYRCFAMSRTRRADYAGARAMATAAITATQAAAQPHLEARVLQTIGITYLADGDATQGLSHLEQALTLAQQVSDYHLEANIRGSLGSGYYVAGNFANAYRYLQQAWQTSQALRLPGIGIVALNWLSSFHIQVGRYDLALKNAQEAQQAARQIGRHTVEIEAYTLLALAAYYQGEQDAATHYCQAAIQLAEAYNARQYTVLARLVQGHLLCTQAQWQAAAVAYEQALQAYVSRAQPLWNLRAQAGLAQCAFAVGDRGHALMRVEEFLPILEKSGQSGGMNIYETILIGYEILTATADSRADTLLQQGYRLLQEQAAHFDDEALRHTFVEQVAANRDLISAARLANLC